MQAEVMEEKKMFLQFSYLGEEEFTGHFQFVILVIKDRPVIGFKLLSLEREHPQRWLFCVLITSFLLSDSTVGKKNLFLQNKLLL